MIDLKSVESRPTDFGYAFNTPDIALGTLNLGFDRQELRFYGLFWWRHNESKKSPDENAIRCGATATGAGDRRS